jgi:divalent metal cation (Fe/Co/Zn/Cd) transporter
VSEVVSSKREGLARRARTLEYLTIAWNIAEGLAAIIAGWHARSIALLAFGIDSAIEVTSASALLWRIKVDPDVMNREQNERLTLRIVGVSFIMLAAYTTAESVFELIDRRMPDSSLVGIVVACLAVVIMPLLSRAKRRLATALGSAAMHADAKQADFCACLSLILLAGLALNAAFAFWWADPVAALMMVPIIAHEGVEGLRGKSCGECQ